MYQTERTVRVIRDPQPGRRVSSSWKHLERGWLPVNPQVLERFNERLANGTYSKNSEILRADLKADLSLFGHVMRTAGRTLRSSGSPLNDLTQADSTLFERAKTLRPHDISAYQLSEASLIQVRQNTEAIRSVVMAETLAQEHLRDANGVMPDDVFTAVALHELTKQLVAWNYPVLVSRAMYNSRKDDEDIETHLATALGVSLKELSLDFGRRCGCSPLILAPYQTQRRTSGASTTEQTNLSQMIEVCTDAQHFSAAQREYPSPMALDTWAQTQTRLLARFGKQRFQQLIDSVDVRVEEQVKALIECVNPSVLRPRISELKRSVRARQLFAKNIFTARSEPALAQGLSEVYNQISQEREVCIAGVEILISKCMAAGGFPSGAIYMFNREGSKLVPIIQFGKYTVRAAREVAFFRQELIAQSVYRETPLMQEHIEDNERQIEIAGAIGASVCNGVLYALLDRSFVDRPDYDAVGNFRALQQALNDCMLWEKQVRSSGKDELS